MSQANIARLPGRNGVMEAISWGKVDKLYLVTDYGRDEKLVNIYAQAKKSGVSIELVSPKLLNKMAWENQGVVAEIVLPGEDSLETIVKNKRDAVLVLVSQIDYEQNLGALIRTAWATGVDAIVVAPSGVTGISSVTAKISMGGVAFVPVYFQSLFATIKMLHKYAVKLIGVEVGAGKPVFETNLTGGVALLFGGEAKGLSQPLINDCDAMTHIPMTSSIASVNLSVAAGVVLFERMRQAVGKEV